MRARLLALALTLPLLGACATKRDLRDLRHEVQSLQTSQEALLREIRRQNEMILDSLTIKDVRLRGDLSNRMLQLERQLVQIQELTGQGQQRLAELRQQLRSQEEALRAAAASSTGAAAGNPDELFTAAEAALQRGSLTSARAGFEEFVNVFPNHPRVAAAKLAIGETFERANEPARAIETYQRVVEQHPDSPQAATALLRAALVEVKRGNRDRARSMLNQVIAAYPRSPEAGEAKDQLAKLRR